MGAGDRTLGDIILATFLRLLLEKPVLPEYIVLWNDGVRIAAKGSQVLDHLKRLEEKGVKIISCLTCVEYLGLLDNIKAGQIKKMPEIMDVVLGGPTLTLS